MTEKRTLQYGTQQIRTFALHSDPDILINADPLRHIFSYFQAGVTANKGYIWEIKESIEVEKLFAVFPTGVNPSGKLTLYILPSPSGTPEFEVEFNMASSIVDNAYTVDLGVFPPIGDGKYGKIVSTVNLNSITVVARHVHLYDPIPPSLIV